MWWRVSLYWGYVLERNRRSFENKEKTLDELKVLSHRSLFEWSRCWGFTESSSLPEFLSSLSFSIWFPSSLFGCLFLLFLIVHHHEHLVLFIFYLLIIVLILPIKKKEAGNDWIEEHALGLCSAVELGHFHLLVGIFVYYYHYHFFCFLFTVFVLLTVNIIIIYIYSHNEFKLSLIFYFILFFGYAHEFILFLLLLGFWWFIYIRLFIFCTTLTHL